MIVRVPTTHPPRVVTLAAALQSLGAELKDHGALVEDNSSPSYRLCLSRHRRRHVDCLFVMQWLLVVMLPVKFVFEAVICNAPRLERAIVVDCILHLLICWDRA